MSTHSGSRLLAPSKVLACAIASAKRDPHGGKVLLPLDVAEKILADLKRRQ